MTTPEEHGEQVTTLLTRLEELAPQIARSRRDLWMSKFRNLMAYVALVAFILAGIALLRVGIIDRHQVKDAARGKVTADCVNTVLGVRAISTVEETAARKEYAVAQLRFAQGQTEAFRLITAQNAKNTPRIISAVANGTLKQVLEQISKEPTPGLDKLLAVEADFTTASHKFVSQLQSIETFRMKHPLGRC